MKTPLLAGLFLCLLALPCSAQLYGSLVGESKDYIVAEEQQDLVSIAKEFNLAIEHLAFANGLPESATKVSVGTPLTIPHARILPKNPPKNGLVLNIPERGLYLFKNGKYDRFIPVSVGTPPKAKTLAGSFHIIERIKDPTWYPPSWADSPEPVGPGPNNPLGDRWIGISSPMVGIHGTNDPLNVGASVTHGCIRCYPEDVRQLFEEVKVGLPVRIEYETAKLGKSASGEVFLATFPDIYDEQDPKETALKLLKKSGYGSLANDKNFVFKLELNLGTPLSLDKEKKRVLQEAQAASVGADSEPKEE